MSKEWLSKLKEGDTVVVHSCNWTGSHWGVAKIQKITQKGFIRAHDILFKPEDGYSRGGGSCLLDPNDEEVKKSVSKYRNDCFIRMVLKQMWSAKELTYEQAIEKVRILGDVEK